MVQSLYCAFGGSGKIGEGGENGLGLASLLMFEGSEL